MPQPNAEIVLSPRARFSCGQSYILAGVALVVLVYLVPELIALGLGSEEIAAAVRTAGLPIPIALLIAGPVLFATQQRGRQQPERPTELGSLRALTDRQFQQRLAAAFKQQGYAVDVRISSASDGIELVLRQDGSVTLVQCGHWRQPRVGAETLRALHKVMCAEHATGALIVTIGAFTAEAIALAQNKPIGLIEGTALLELLRSGQMPQPRSRPPRDEAPSCHVCSRPMVRRAVRRGFSKVEAYWECSGSPYCKGTRLEKAA